MLFAILITTSLTIFLGRYMKLIVFKGIVEREKYQALLMEGIVWSRRGPKVLHFIENTVAYICADDMFGLRFLRGYQFDEVLWVGYEDRFEVDHKAPMELLARTYGAKYHYCKPPEAQNSPSKPSYNVNLPKGNSVNFNALQPSSETDELVDEYRKVEGTFASVRTEPHRITVKCKEYEDLPESLRQGVVSGNAILLVKGV